MKRVIIGLVVVIGVVATIVYGGTRLPNDVQPIAWNSEPCAHCHMVIGDPAFAAQVITDEGTVLSFDDPGCAARYLREHRGHIHRAWFHDGRGQRWLALADVAFVRVVASPMGSNVIAVPNGTPGAASLESLQ